MAYIIAGLGNPGEEYKITRHNAGRIILEAIAKNYDFADFKENPKLKALVSKGQIGDESVTLIEPNNYMNKSGASIAPLITSLKKAHNLVVIYDDLDLPIGRVKISFNKSSGGHKGVESIIRALKTQEFIRVRIGISPTTPSGKMKKPIGGDVVEKHILGPFKKPELDVLKKVSKNVFEALEVLMESSIERVMTEFNNS